MGIYINKGNGLFRQTRNSEYIDKSGLIAVINQTLFTQNMFTCVTRSRRFGKSMAAKMLAAYYDKSCDSHSLFADLQIAQHPTFEEHLNKYPVIYLDLSDFAMELGKRDIVNHIMKALIADIKTAYPKVPMPRGGTLMDFLQRIHDSTGETFFFIVDEWDAILREAAMRAGKDSEAIKDDFLNWLRSMFKSVRGMEVFAGVYMTGILPVKKYKTESAMNNFQEYSVVTPGALAPFFGFTMDFDLDKDDTPDATLRISYNADPDRYEELNPIVYGQMKAIADKGPEATSLAKVKEYLIKQYDQVAITNDYWNYVIWHELDDNADFDTGYKDLVQGITTQDVQQMAQRLMHSGYRVEVTMLSE